MAKKHFRIGFDFDDVLVGTADHVASLYNKEYGTHLTRDNWYNFNPITPWNVKTFSEVTSRVANLLYNLGEARPLAGSQQVLSRLKDAGHELFIITGRPESVRPQTLGILNKYYPGIFDNSSLYFTDHFSQDGKRVEKSNLCNDLNLTHFIDDQVEHANIVAAEGVKTILFSDNYAWNQSGADDNVTKLSSWQKIEEFFNDEQRKT